MNNITKIILGLLVLLVAILVGLTVLHKLIESSEDDINSVNAKKVRLGMTSADVIQIMGKPENGSVSLCAYLRYHYNPPGSSSYGIIFYFDSSEIVRRIEREDSSFFDSEYKEEIIADHIWFLDTTISQRAGKKIGHR